MTNNQAEEKIKLRKLWIEQAINLAMQSKWKEAVEANKKILDLFDKEGDSRGVLSQVVEAYNRLGKAYSELGYYKEAREAYNQTLKLDPNNTIARKNIDRLSLINDTASPVREELAPADRVDPRLFIEETGKTGVTTLVTTVPEIVSRLIPGDQVLLEIKGLTLQVLNARKEVVGQVEARLGQRLINFMKAGNQYAAAITSLEHSQVKIIIRETFQHPSQIGRVSFPSQGTSDAIRPYIKDSVLRYEHDDEDEISEEGEYLADTESDPEDVSEMDFYEEDQNEPE